MKLLYDLTGKLEAIAHAGLRAIKLAFPDFVSFASQHLKHDVDPQKWDSLYDVAKEMRQLCESLKLETVMLQPFSNFKG